MLKICVDELKTSKYKAFINYAFSTCDFLSFIVDYENQPQDDFLEKLETTCMIDIIEKRKISVHPETGTHFDGGYMITVKCNAYMKSLLMNASDITAFDGVALPEELCFYRNRCVWFKFISHEWLAFVLNESNDDITFLQSCKIAYHYTI